MPSSPDPLNTGTQTSVLQSSSPTQTFTLDIQSDAVYRSRDTIFDEDNVTPLYHVETHWLRKPQISLTSTSTGQEIASVASLHCTTLSTIDCTLYDPHTEYPVKLRRLMGGGYTFPAPISSTSKSEDRKSKEGATWTWRSQSVWGYNIVCENERGEAVARFENELWSVKKKGRLELLGGVIGVGEGEEWKRVMEAVLVTGWAVMEYRHRRNYGY